MRRIHRIHSFITDHQALRIGFFLVLIGGGYLIGWDIKHTPGGITKEHVAMATVLIGVGAWLLRRPVKQEESK